MVQHAILSLLETAHSQQQSGVHASVPATGQQLSAPSLAHLLRLLCSSGEAEVAKNAETVVEGWLEQAVGFVDGGAEVSLWLDLLPRHRSNSELAR